MALALKAKKELEIKVHEEFYKNMYILTICYPPSQDFRAIFKKDMFVKNNKAGFHEVVHYLFDILHRDNRLKQKITAWPVLSIRYETDFRNEVMKCIAELNAVYGYANIPQLATSHLISPGGFKFVKFMLSFSQLTLFVHLKNYTSIAPLILYPLKPSKQNPLTSENIENRDFITKQIKEETRNIKNNFEMQFNKAKLEALHINNERRRVHKSIKEKQGVLDDLKKELTGNSINADLEIEEKLNKSIAFRDKFKKCELLGSFLNGTCSKLEIQKNLKIPSQVAHIVHYDGTNLILPSFVEGFNALIDRKRLELHLTTDEELKQQIERFKKLNTRFLLMDTTLDAVNSELLQVKETLQNEQKKCMTVHSQQNQTVSSCDFSNTSLTPLAVPFSPSLTEFEEKLKFDL